MTGMSAREPLSSFVCQVMQTVDFGQPAVTRKRELAASAFGYSYSGEPDFGLHGITDGIEIQPYAVIMPSASRDDKLWPEADWQKVFARLHEHDLDLKLLSGSPAETERARQLVAGNPRAQVLPRMNLTEVARVLAGARSEEHTSELQSLMSISYA